MNWFKNLKISKKLIVGFLVVAIVAAVVGVIGIVNLATLSRADQSMYRSQALGLQYSGAAAVNFQQLRYNLLKMTTLTDEASLADTEKLVTQYQAATKENLGEFTNITAQNDDISAEIKTLAEDIVTLWGSYELHVKQYLTFVENKQYDQGSELAFGTMAPIGATIRDDFLQLMQLVADSASAASQANSSASQVAMLLMAGVVVLAVVIALLLGAYIARIIGRPVGKMAQIAKLLARGDIETEGVLDSKDYQLRNQKDEIGALAGAFHDLIATTKRQVDEIQKLADGDLTIKFEMSSEKDLLGKGLITLAESLNSLIGSIMTASDQVTSGAGLVSNSSMALSQGATEQASAIEELTASLEEIASQTNLNAQNADTANSLALEARENASAGDGYMKNMLRAMDEISMSSKNINKIIKTIDDIAFQTNILALNAAVEAARAGQQGKGFAVVAEEVRTLAAKSANAVKETTELIEDSIRKVNAGTSIAGQTAQALKQIVGQVEKAGDLIHSIAVASKEQAVGVEQISQGITQVSQVVQTNAATAEESAAASEELNAQAEQLRATVSIFKVKKSAAGFEGAADTVSRAGARRPRGMLQPSKRPALSLGEGDYGKY